MPQKAIYLPNEAGTAIGGPRMSRYVLLEVHLNNPSRRKGTEHAGSEGAYGHPESQTVKT